MKTINCSLSLSLLAFCALFAQLVYAEGVESESALVTNTCGPAGELRGDLEKGKALHVEHCVACHGLTGQADVVVMHMDETPPDQSDPAYMQTLSDGYLYIAICRGGEGVGKSYVMSPWGDYFTDQEIKDLIGWVRTFSET
jgi:mono/diheme cytochrome c family protein